jgi:uncharacterized protein (DUF58 family)
MTKHFDPSVLAKLKNLYVRARFVVDGVMVGIHPSRAKGFSSDFEGHRQYSQGDDVRHIDWKTYGKFDRYFVKEYREATNLRGYIFLDVSSSMSYASNGWSKFDYGSTLAASLAYLMLRQQDSVGLITFSNKIEKMIPPKATPGHLFAILKELEERKPDGETSAGSVLQELAGSFKRKGLIILISDLLDKPEEVVRGLKQLRSRGSDVMVFHVLDRDELEFPFEEPTIFRDLEEDLKLLTDPRSVRSAYLKTVHSLIEGYREACAAHLVDYSLFNTSIGLDRALVRYLSWRAKFKAGP